VPIYEYRCLDCETVFEQRRPMAEADADVLCPDGHGRAKRLLPMFASARSGGSSSAPAPSMAPARSGGGCGPACGCH
jgi:putative FmdB family regulatory protein